MYKVMFDNRPSGVLYVLKRVAIQVTEDGRIRITLLKPGQQHLVLQSASFEGGIDKVTEPERKMFWLAEGGIDKVTEPERKMFWLAFGSILRTMGVIK